MSRIQLKIFAALSLLVVTVVFVTGLLIERDQQKRVIRNIERLLTDDARMVGLVTAGLPYSQARSADLASATARSASVIRARVTLIDTMGRVVADSEVPDAEIAMLENHADRPEVREALAGRIGTSTRFSESVRRTLVYVAIPEPVEDSNRKSGVIRLALGVDRLEAAAAELRGELIGAAALGLLAALGLSYGLSILTLRPIRELSEVVSDIASGELGRQLHWGANDERGAIARAINRMARRMREQLAATETERSQLESVLSSMVEGVLVVDSEGRIVLANPRLRDLLSAWGEVEGRPLHEVFRDPAVGAALKQASCCEEPFVSEFELRGPKQLALLLRAEPISKGGLQAGAVIVIQDVTELRRVDRIRRDFIANASHELRTPLTAIQGFADTLSAGGVGIEQHRQYLDVIARNAQRMSDLVDDLLALSRIEQDGFELDLSDVDVGRVAEMMLFDFGARFEEAGLSADLHLHARPMARADRRAVEQILDNLLSNAARYTNEGGHVDLTVEATDGAVTLTVTDDGIGIPEDSRQRIFERFYRVDGARSRAFGGTGLGLSIVKHLVAQMGGEIEVESTLGLGSRFIVTLPAASG